MFSQFRKFIMRGNVLDLAVAVIIGGAFAKITQSLTNDIIMPIAGWIFGGADFSSYFILLGPVPDSYHGSPHDYAALKAAGAAMFGYGEFVTTVINFLMLAFIVFLIVRAVNKMMGAFEHDKPEVAAPEPTDVVLLREIRDELRARRGPEDAV